MSKDESLTKKKGGDRVISPVFVEAEKMFDRIAEITRETAQKAYDFFQNRGAAIGSHLDDWFKAESEIQRSTPVEITETNDAVSIRAAVPGFKPNEIEISVKDNILILSGETKSEEKTEGENVFYSEWRSNRFCRQLTLPSEVETENVEAHLREGVLQLSLKKKEPEEVAKIAVKYA